MESNFLKVLRYYCSTTWFLFESTVSERIAYGPNTTRLLSRISGSPENKWGYSGVFGKRFRYCDLVCKLKSELFVYTIKIKIFYSERTLKRWLQKQDIRRHDATITPQLVINAVEAECRGPRRYCGIRVLHFLLRNKHNLLVTRYKFYG